MLTALIFFVILCHHNGAQHNPLLSNTHICRGAPGAVSSTMAHFMTLWQIAWVYAGPR